MSRKGFTLLEVLIVVAVIAILAGISFGLMRTVESARITATTGRVHSLGIEAGWFLKLKGLPPKALEDLAPRLQKPEWMKDGKFVDGWDRPFEYRVDGTSFRLWSNGPDGIAGTADDLEYKRN